MPRYCLFFHPRVNKTKENYKQDIIRDYMFSLLTVHSAARSLQLEIIRSEYFLILPRDGDPFENLRDMMKVNKTVKLGNTVYFYRPSCVNSL